MDCSLIFECYHTKYLIFKFTDFPPKPKTIIFLWFNFNGILNYPNTPLFLKIRSFTQYFVFEIRCKFIFIHTTIITFDSLNSKMKDFLLDSSSLMFQFLQPRAVQDLLKEHTLGKNDNYKILFSIVAFEEWLREIKSFSYEVN